MYIDISVVQNCIRCDVSEHITDILDKKYLPLKFKIYSQISEDVLYECELDSGMWGVYNGGYRDIDAKILTNNGILLRKYEHVYFNDITHNDSVLYEFWDYFARTNKGSNGVIIGAGDGSWGEWVLPVNDNKMKCHLIEGSKKTFKRLEKNYKNKQYSNLYNLIITNNGEECNFYDVDLLDGLSTTNLDYLKKILSPDSSSNFYIDGEDLNFDDIDFGDIEKRKSIQINNLLEIIGDVDWIRIDVEGGDYELIMSIDDTFLSSLKMIQYEHLDLEKEKQEILNNLLTKFGFTKIVFSIDTVFIKPNKIK